MADIYTIVKRLEKKKNVDENLALFANHMMTCGNRLSYIRFTLNYPTFYEVTAERKSEGKEIPKPVKTAIQTLNQIIKDYLENPFSEEKLKTNIGMIEELRQENIRMMQLLTAYGDRYAIYEYVLNRMEYQFQDQVLEESYSDEAFTEQILAFLTAEKDHSIQQRRTIEVIEQLPMRMAKSHFMQILQDGLMVYTDSERETVEELLFMIRTAAMMEEPEGLSDVYPELYETINSMKQVDFSGLSEDDYKKMAKKLKEGFETLNKDIDLCMLLEELTNDLYVIFLSNPYALADLQERQLCESMIHSVLDYFGGEDNREIEESEFEKLFSLEGVQEDCYEWFQAGEAMLSEVTVSYQELAEELMLDKIYCSLNRMSQLLSSSIYIDLKEKDQHAGIADKEYIIKTYMQLSKELKEHLKEQPKCIARAIMAKVLTLLPMFLRNYQELEDYIRISLSSCRDQAEKLACIEILDAMMKE